MFIKTKTPSFYFAAGCLSVFAMLGAFWLLLFVLDLMLGAAFPADRAGTTNILTASTSPNDEFVATSYVNMGGGAAGWCGTSVNVRRRHEQFTPDESVFGASCGTNINLRWEDDKTLRIEFSSDDKIVSLSQHRWSRDKAIEIHYSESKHEDNE